MLDPTLGEALRARRRSAMTLAQGRSGGHRCSTHPAVRPSEHVAGCARIRGEGRDAWRACSGWPRRGPPSTSPVRDDPASGLNRGSAMLDPTLGEALRARRRSAMTLAEGRSGGRRCSRPRGEAPRSTPGVREEPARGSNRRSSMFDGPSMRPSRARRGCARSLREGRIGVVGARGTLGEALRSLAVVHP